jgi:putative hydrolase of the HAD superfamily
MTFDITTSRQSRKGYVLNGAHRAVMFDLDDTLVAWDSRHRASLHHLADRLVEVHPDGPEPGAWLDALTTSTEADVLWGQVVRGELDQLGLHSARIRMALDHIGLPVGDEDVEALARAYRQQMVANAHLDAGVAGMLAELGAWYRLGVITNGCAPIQLPTLERLGLNHGLFDLVLCANEVGTYKPHPAIYEQMLDATGLRPHEVVMVGDNYEHDVVGAAELGMDAIWINIHGAATADREAASAIIDHVLDLRQLVSRQ